METTTPPATPNETDWRPVSPDVERRLKQLYEPVPPEKIVYQPRLVCRNCKIDAVCENSRHVILKECANCHTRDCTSAHLDIPGLNHVYVQGRFNEVDPGWSMEPVGVDERGNPALAITVTQKGQQKVEMANLWMWFTVCGIRRLVVGTVVASKESLLKELYSDAIKIAGLRFGVGGGLRTSDRVWAREAGSRPPAARQSASAPAPAAAVAPVVPKVETEVVEAMVARIAATKTVPELRAIQDELRDPGKATLRSVEAVRTAFLNRANQFKLEQAGQAVAAAPEQLPLTENPESGDDDSAQTATEASGGDDGSVELPAPRRGRKANKQAA